MWLDHFSFNAAYKKSAWFYQRLLGWGTTYDEGSQHELMMGEAGDIIIRGGNALGPEGGRNSGAAAGRASITSPSASRRGTPTT